jgi:hypothetical protein
MSFVDQVPRPVRLFLHADAARGVAGTAMTRALDQIGAAIPDRVVV